MKPTEISMNVSQETFWGFLCDAAREGDADYYFTLIASGADPLQRRAFEPDEDYAYAGWYDDEVYGEVYTRSPKPVEYDTILCVAARSGCAAIVEHLIGLGEDVQHIGQSGYPALAYWAKGRPNDSEHCQREKTFHLLIEAGARPDDFNNLAINVLHERTNNWDDEHPEMALIRQWERDQEYKQISANTVQATAPRKAARL